MSFGKRHYTAAPYAETAQTGAAHEVGAAVGRFVGLLIILATVAGVVWVVVSGAWLTVGLAVVFFALIGAVLKLAGVFKPSA